MPPGDLPVLGFADPGAWESWLAGQRIGDAKRPETRARRIATYVAMLAAHETIYPQG